MAPPLIAVPTGVHKDRAQADRNESIFLAKLASPKSGLRDLGH